MYDGVGCGAACGGVITPLCADTSSTAYAVPLEVNCPAGAREATLGCPLKGKVKPVFGISALSVTALHPSFSIFNSPFSIQNVIFATHKVPPYRTM